MTLAVDFAYKHVRTRWRRVLPSCIALVATVAASGCSLGDRTGDGLVGDGRQIHLEPSEATNPPPEPMVGSGSADGGAADPNETECVALPLFVDKVVPQFEKYCIECHDGAQDTAESTALVKLPMDFIRSHPGPSCTLTLDDDIVNTENVHESTVLTSSNPERPDVQHDFKFEEEGLEAYKQYEAVLLEWIKAEAQGG